MSNLKIVNQSGAPIPCGRYRGSWCGYTIWIKTQAGVVEAKTNDGVRGMVAVEIVSDGNGLLEIA